MSVIGNHIDVVFEIGIIGHSRPDRDQQQVLFFGFQFETVQRMRCHAEQKEGRVVVRSHAAVNKGECLQRIEKIPPGKLRWEMSVSQNKAVLLLVTMHVETVYENATHRPGSSKRSGDNSPSHQSSVLTSPKRASRNSGVG
jgi:hypothetical protein